MNIFIYSRRPVLYDHSTRTRHRQIYADYHGAAVRPKAKPRARPEGLRFELFQSAFPSSTVTLLIS